MASRGATKPGRVWLERLAWGISAVAVLAFAIEGGEYGTRDLWRQARRQATLERELAALHHDVDSLSAELKSLRTDDARLEQMARERYGMVQGDKELLYWVGPGAPKDSTTQ